MKDLSKNFWITCIVICIVLIIVVSCGFVIVKNKKPKVVRENDRGGSVVLNYSSNVSGLSITNAVGTADLVGMKSDEDGSYFDFSISSKLYDAKGIDYEVSVVKEEGKCSISDDDIRVYLEKEKDGTYTKVFGPKKFDGIKLDSSLGSSEGSMVLTKVHKIKSGKDNYRLRIWLTDGSLVQGGNYSVLVEVHGKAK